MKLTIRQTQILSRIIRENARGYDSCISPDVAKQLIKKGLVFKLSEYRPDNGWNKSGPVLWKVSLTEEGKKIS